jgi:hypothetical protein
LKANNKAGKDWGATKIARLGVCEKLTSQSPQFLSVHESGDMYILEAPITKQVNIAGLPRKICAFWVAIGH